MSVRQNLSDPVLPRMASLAQRLAFVPIICGTLVLSGWLTGNTDLYAFGVGPIGMRRLTAIAFIALGCSLLALVKGRARGSLGFAVFASAIALYSPVKTLLETHTDLEWIDAPRLTTSLLILLTAGGIVLRSEPDTRWSRCAIWLATASLMISATSLLGYLSGVAIPDIHWSLYVISLPGALGIFATSAGTLMFRYREGWPLDLARVYPEARRARGVLLFIIIFSVAITLIFCWLAQIGIFSEDLLTAQVVVINIALTTFFVLVSLRTALRNRIERDQLAGAIDLAAVMILGPDGVIRHWSTGCEVLFGWPAHIAIGQRRGELLKSVLAAPGQRGAWSTVLEEGKWDGELLEQHRDGFILTIQNHSKLIDLGAEGNAVVVTMSDITERKQAAAALRTSEARLAAAIDTHGICIFEIDLKARRIDWITTSKGKDGNNWSALPTDLNWWQDPSNNLYAEELRAMVREVTEEKRERVALRYAFIGPDGQWHTMEGSARVIFDEQGMRWRAIGASLDVTARVEREEALRLSEARLATAAAAQGICVYEWDVEKKDYVWALEPESFFGIKGLTAETMRNMPLFMETHAADPLVDKYRQTVRDHGETLDYDFEFLRGGVDLRYAEGWARIIYGPDDKPERLIGAFRDVTNRTVRERELHRSEAQMRAILAAVPDMMMVCDSNEIIRSFSKAGEDLFQRSAEAIVGRPLDELVLVSPGEKANVQEMLSRVRRTDFDRTTPVVVFAALPDGSTIPFAVTGGETIVDGEPMSVIFGRDLRPQMENEARFLRLQNELAQVSRLGIMGEMAAALAHELSQPLAAIVNFLGAAELMLERVESPMSDRMADAVRRAGDQATRAGEIIRRLRAFITRGEADMRVNIIDGLVREAAALAMVNSSTLGIQVFYDFENGAREILADRVQIQQVLVNLIRNALDAMRSAGVTRPELHITTSLIDNDYLMISVADNGPGVGPEILNDLFVPFATTKAEGLGFGLSISRRIVEAHGGELTAQSTLGCGAVFQFTIPIIHKEGVN